MSMPLVVADISMSVDGFVTGPDPDLENGLGRGGEPLHHWVFEGDEVDAGVLRDATEASGAVVMGRRLFDIIDGPLGWNDEVGYGAGQAGTPPFFVVTHAPPDKVRLGLNFMFVTAGPKAAIDQARVAAADKDVVVMGGADVIRQCVLQGLVDELRIHLAPVVLGGGTPLFSGGESRQLVQRSVLVSSKATHLSYAVASG
jgi:dihydrofolate reductase